MDSWVMDLKVEMIDALDFSTECLESEVDIFISTIDLDDILDNALALGTECGDEECGAGTDIGAVHGLGKEVGGSDDDSAMGVTEDNFSAHIDQIVDKEESAFKHFFKDEDCTGALCGNDEGNAGEVGRESWPWGIIDFGHSAMVIGCDFEGLIFGDDEVLALFLDVDTEFFKDHKDHSELGEIGVLDEDLALSDCGECDEAGDFDIIG